MAPLGPLPAFLGPLLSLVGSIASAIGLVAEPCTTTLFVERLVFDEVCLKKFISKGLGYAMTGAASFVRAPQIRTMYKSKSSLGLSSTSVYLELLMYGLTVAYNILQGNPFAAYGENVMLVVQATIIMVLMWAYSGTSRLEILFMLGTYATLGFLAMGLGPDCGPLEGCWSALTSGALPGPCSAVTPCRTFLISAVAPLMLASRVPNIFLCFREKHTGVLSPVTLSMNALGGILRIFTTIQEVGFDLGMLSSFISGAALNLILLAQYFVYRKNTIAMLEEAKAKAEAEARKKKA